MDRFTSALIDELIKIAEEDEERETHKERTRRVSRNYAQKGRDIGTGVGGLVGGAAGLAAHKLSPLHRVGIALGTTAAGAATGDAIGRFIGRKKSTYARMREESGTDKRSDIDRRDWSAKHKIERKVRRGIDSYLNN